jgi:uncharacterized lipoprotein YddW (UPF0748 family)
MKSVLAFACVLLAAVYTAAAAPVVVVAQKPGYYTSLAKHAQRWLQSQGIAAALATPQTMSAALADARIAFLIGFEEPTAAEMRVIRALRARGGKLAVFHSASPALANLMGVQVLGYTTAPYPGAWSRMNFDTSSLAGCPRAILQTSTVLQRARPVKGRSTVLANWMDRAGRVTGDAAWLRSDAGFWMTHVLLADGDEALKARLLAAMCGAADPRIWNAAAFAAREKKRTAALHAYAAAQTPRRGEIHAVWDHSGCGLTPGNWPRTIALLKASHVTDLFVNVAGAGFAHYPSTVLPRSKTFRQEGDQLAQCTAAARGSGIRVHAWLLCFTATRATPAQLDTFRARGWRLKTRDGRLSEYLDPANADVRRTLLAAIDEIQANYRIDGIHLDFVRWYERSQRPRNAADIITRFVMDARRRTRRPRWLTTAVLGKYPACVASVGQDWPSWLNLRLVDYVVPMDYTESLPVFESYLRQHASTRSAASRTIAGIGVTANESRLDARQVIDQIKLARRYGLAGAALFDLDVTLEKQILPYLRLGLW